jgi:hypothetical protein
MSFPADAFAPIANVRLEIVQFDVGPNAIEQAQDKHIHRHQAQILSHHNQERTQMPFPLASVARIGQLACAVQRLAPE